MAFNEHYAGGAVQSSASSLLRIAIPSWRFVGIHFEPGSDVDAVSREEIQALFHGELNPKSNRKGLTEAEERQRSLARKIRNALYPRPFAN